MVLNQNNLTVLCLIHTILPSKVVSSFAKAGVTHSGATRSRTDVRPSPVTPRSTTNLPGRSARISESPSQNKHRTRRSSGLAQKAADRWPYRYVSVEIYCCVQWDAMLI